MKKLMVPTRVESSATIIMHKISFLSQGNAQPTVIESSKIERDIVTNQGKKDIALTEKISHSITTSVEDQEIIIEFYDFQLGGLKKNYFGRAKLNVRSMMNEAYEKDGIWGYFTVSKLFDLVKPESDEIIGCLSATAEVSYNRYPKNVKPKTDFSKDARIDWLAQYKIVLKALVKAREKLPDTMCESFLCPSQAWVLNDFENRFGITETYKRLIYLEVFCSNSKLAITFADDLKKCLELLDTR